MATLCITAVKQAFHQDLSGEHIRAERYPEGSAGALRGRKGRPSLWKASRRSPRGSRLTGRGPTSSATWP